MAFFLCKVTKGHWLWGKDVPWLPAGELQSAVFLDLRPTENVLSVWQIMDDHSNLDRTIAALAAMRDTVSNFDYFLLEEQFVAALNISIQNTPGTTKDTVANKWHYDLGLLSASQLLAVALLFRSSGHPGRCSEKRVRALLEAAVASGNVPFDELRDSLKTKLLSVKPVP